MSAASAAFPRRRVTLRGASIEELAARLRREGVPFVHARVVLAERPTSAKPGDAAVVLADGTMEGFVGGACAESTVRSRALGLLDSGESLLLRICPNEEADQPRKVVVHNPCLSGGTLEIFLQPSLPAPVIAVVGDSPIATALRRLAPAIGLAVGEGGEVPGTASVAAVIVASHGRDDEASVLRTALHAGVPYVGLVASPRRGQTVVAGLGMCPSMTAAVRTPAGLDIGARTPEEVALSILAEIVALRPRASGRSPGELGASAEIAVDPVCGMSVAMVESSLHLDHDGARLWFCGSGCLRAFAAAHPSTRAGDAPSVDPR